MVIRKRTISSAAALVALALLVPACSSSRSATSDAPGGGGTTTTAASSASGKFGTLASPCGKGDAKGATEQGVTDSSITIGYGDDRGFASSPGLNAEMGDAVKAMISWCNDQGGINGRKVVGNQYDAAITKANTVIQQSCKTDFMLVGQGFAGDAGGEATRVGCNLATVPGFVVAPEALNGPMMYQPFPTPVDLYSNSVFSHLAQLDPAAKDGTELINTTLPAVLSTNLKVAEGAKAAGYNLKNCNITTSYSGEPNFVPFAEKYKSCGIKAAFYPGNPTPPMFNLLQAINQVGMEPTYILGTGFYSETAAKWDETAKLPKANVDMAYQPFENANLVPAVQKYLDVVGKAGGKTALLGMQATSAFLLWATEAQKCGSDLTRQCMVNNLAKVHDWTGGGLHATTDPGKNMPSACSLTVKLQDGKFSQVIPATKGEFDCNDKYIVKVPESVWGTTLGADRIATKYLSPKVLKPQA